MKDLGKALWALSDAVTEMEGLKREIIAELSMADDPSQVYTTSELMTLKYGFAKPVGDLVGLTHDFAELVNDIEDFDAESRLIRLRGY